MSEADSGLAAGFADLLMPAAAVLLAAGGAVLTRAPEAPPASAPHPSTPPSPAPDRHLPGSASVYPGGAFDRDCSHAGRGLDDRGYRFITSCAGRAVSSDGRWAVVRGEGDQGSVTLRDAEDRLLDDIPNLNDAMPFILHWSPHGDWFFANHYQGSSLERLRVFEIVNRTAVERSGVYANAIRAAVDRYPCLGRSASVFASGWQWSRDGRRIAMTVYARPNACLVERGEDNWVPDGEWHVLWMIGDVRTGRIDPASVRVRRNGVGRMPNDGPYAEL